MTTSSGKKRTVYRKRREREQARNTRILFVLLAVLISFLFVLTLVQTTSSSIAGGVTAGGVDLSGLSKEDALSLLQSRIAEASDEVIEMDADGDRFSATARDLGVFYNCEETVENAFAYGHSGFFSSILPALRGLFRIPKPIDLVYDINDITFEKFMASHTDYSETVEAHFTVTDDAVVVTNGQSAFTVDPTEVREALHDKLKTLDFSGISFSKTDVSPIPFDLDGFLEEYSRPAEAASYKRDDTGNVYITHGNDRVTLDRKEAERLIREHKEPGETFSIPATVEKSTHTSEELADALFRDVLSSYTTSYASSDANRSTNVALAAKSCNDIVLLPGEVFSYNNALGKRTPEKGYKLAGAYANGESVQEYGGGICQVSSTLYNAAMLADMKIESRTCHMFSVAYVPIGRDATVDYGTVDFCFSNNTDYPVKIHAYTTDAKQVVCEIIGTKTRDFSVSFETSDVTSVPYTTKETPDPTLPAGTEKVVKGGSNGLRCTVYRIVTVDGAEASRTQTSSYYMPHNAEKLVGTKAVPASAEVETPTTPTPAETPTTPAPVETPTPAETPAPVETPPAPVETAPVEETPAPVETAPTVTEIE